MPPRIAQVLFKDRVAGTLAETLQGGSAFTYDPEWTTSIAIALPVGQGPIVYPNGLHPVFQHLGTEGWLRQKQARAGHFEEEDDFGLLLQYGGDCIGAISVRSSVPGEIRLDELLGDVAATVATHSLRTVSGVQEKLLAYRQDGQFHPAGATGPATFIAKYAPDHRPDLVRNEAFSLRLAAAVLGEGEVTKFELGAVDGIPGTALLVERFDRLADGSKLRLEDFAQILARPKGRGFSGKYSGSYEEIAAAIRANSARPLIDIDRFFGAVVFNILIGNADAHLKNFSLLERPEGLRFSPLYDLLNTLMYGGEYSRSTALEIGGAKVGLDAVDRNLVVTFARDIGLGDKAINAKLAQISKRIASSPQFVPPAAEPEDGFCHRYIDIVRNACARIL